MSLCPPLSSPVLPAKKDVVDPVLGNQSPRPRTRGAKELEHCPVPKYCGVQTAVLVLPSAACSVVERQSKTKKILARPYFSGHPEPPLIRCVTRAERRPSCNSPSSWSNPRPNTRRSQTCAHGPLRRPRSPPAVRCARGARVGGWEVGRKDLLGSAEDLRFGLRERELDSISLEPVQGRRSNSG